MDHLERYRDIVPEFGRFMAVQCEPLPVSARINTLKTDRSSLLERLERQSIKYEPFGWYPLGLRLDLVKPGKLLEYLLGYIHIQEEVSMVPPLVLDPKPCEEVLDLCAAPGGKTTQISQAMENRGVVFANEPSLARIAPLRSNCERLGAVNVAITRYDGRRFPDHLFHRVLVDAPCSSEGRARRDYDLLSRCSQKRSQDIQVLQTGLLRRAVSITRPGGVIVYSTCTYAPEENELVVQKVLDEREARLEQFSLPGLKGAWNN
jgi:NOL1/NOP2/sun family putative RNA methylase